jgi:hypothetical protein
VVECCEIKLKFCSKKTKAFISLYLFAKCEMYYTDATALCN